ncbi:MAG TPA: P-II family nitrogen regulator [Bacteroidetes bacterium]|nr:P-II family nitrogen regulator [Bacteroidota bacterium]
MKEIKAYIRKEQAEIVIRKLEMAGVTGMTVLDANALSQWADSEFFSYSIDLVQKYSTVVKIELICNDNQMDKLTEVIKKYGYTGRSGDGWIFVSEIEKSIRIRTGEENVIG